MVRTEPRLIFLPGNMCDERLWQPVADQVAAAGHAVACAPAPTRDTIEDMAADLLAQHGGALIPVGFSMGAIVALEMARQTPTRIDALALVGLNAAADLPERAANRPRQQRDVLAGLLDEIVANELKPHYFARANHDQQDLRYLAADMARRLGPSVFVSQSEALRRREDLVPVLRDTHRPVLLACGAEDRLCPPDWHRRWQDETDGRAVLHIVPDAGHLLPLEQPEALAVHLISWLNDIYPKELQHG